MKRRKKDNEDAKIDVWLNSPKGKKSLNEFGKAMSEAYDKDKKQFLKAFLEKKL